MNTINKRYGITFASLAVFAAAISCVAEGVPQIVGIESGSATFYSGTNVHGVEVKGVSKALVARAEVVRSGGEVIVRDIDASLPVESLATGMKIRDEHMRRYIFTTADGKAPDLHFSAGTASCPATAQTYSCEVSGNLSIRGLAKPLALNLKVKEQPGSSVFRVAGDAIVKLSDYGIDPPSQFGVKSVNEVEIHLEFTGKQKPAVLPAGTGAGQ